LFFVRDIDSKVLMVWMRINLQSLVFAMHLGYILTGMLLCACMQMSNWEVLLQKIQEQMKDDSVNKPMGLRQVAIMYLRGW
jgi:hypothetical protein